jgi:peptide/nickel transport system permease protein
MTDIGISATAGPPEYMPAGESFDAAPAGPKSYSRQVLDDVLARTNARLGLLWVVLLTLAAVFAPFLANSHPLLLKENDRWSSPLLHHLSAADVTLQISFWTGVIALFLRKMPAKARWLAWIVITLLAAIIAVLTVHPPQLVVYETYRTDQQAGLVQKVIFAPIPFSPDDHLRDQPELRLNAPTSTHWAGTTSDSADLLSNLLHASRIALSIGFISTGIALAIGIVIGGLMGYYVGWVDLIGLRLVEIFDAIPTLLLLLIFVAVFTPNLYVMMAIIGATTWVSYAYFIRAEFLSLRDRDFVHAARAAGLPLRSILFRHMLPNGLTPLIVSASFGVASAILVESTLSFLGIGLVNEASWGNLLNQALGEGGSFYWWIALYPGLAIFLTVFAYNLVGEALRDALDPKLRT